MGEVNEKKASFKERLLRYSRIIVIFAALLIFGGCFNETQSKDEQEKNELAAQEGRDFSSLSIHPDGEELFFVEIDEKRLNSYVLRYHLKNNRLQHYDLPKGYHYTDAKLSPSGKYIVMIRTKDAPLEADKLRESWGNPEIAIMKTSGADLKALKLSDGYKHGPVMSNDDSKIAYWRGSLRPPDSKTFAAKLDIWEVDLKTGADTLFAGQYLFFEGSQMQYLSGDGEILLHAYGPSMAAHPGLFEQSYFKRYNNSQSYKFSRGQTKLPEPILTEFYSARHPLIDKAGNLYFDGERNNSSSFFRKSQKGEIDQWINKDPRFVYRFFSAVPSDGAYIAFIAHHFEGNIRDGKRSIGILDTKTAQWKKLDIPPLKSSFPIKVKLAENKANL